VVAAIVVGKVALSNDPADAGSLPVEQSTWSNRGSPRPARLPRLVARRTQSLFQDVRKQIASPEPTHVLGQALRDGRKQLRTLPFPPLTPTLSPEYLPADRQAGARELFLSPAPGYFEDFFFVVLLRPFSGGPLAARSARSCRACSSVTSVTARPLGRDALVWPSVT
jgi:hypothetical protein